MGLGSVGQSTKHTPTPTGNTADFTGLNMRVRSQVNLNSTIKI